ncbi:zinc finger protein 287 [Manduca sexta]|uniref:Uncharacterized protein n=1 Tax=Manduca sexta TaxID=7130 RepID=A0A921Z4K3_MANSE|nr:zinc finger protein 287 [Manduca sexta]KAG6451201.1 hypothetical protein O3G_MSEX007003 [Manduca sexta]
MLALLYQMKSSKRPIDYEDYYRNFKHNAKTKQDIASKCRVCLSKGTISLSDNENYAELLEALQIFADISINENNDEYPKNLCKVCHKFLRGAILFRKMARETEEALNQTVKEEKFVEPHDSTHDYDDIFDAKEPSKWQNIDFPDTIVKTEKKAKPKYPPKVTCHVCNKVLNRSYYKEHMTMHDPDHPKYICDVCGKSFRLRCAYHNHSLRHKDDFPYKCQFCPYRGRYLELLKTHMRTHTGDYRYMCTECPARFLFKSNLNSHMLKHKEPQFKCDGCKRAFHTKLMLQRHYEADHLGIKNHVCNMCGKAFGYRNAMMKHQRHVHKREKMLYGRMPSYLQAELKKRGE